MLRNNNADIKSKFLKENFNTDNLKEYKKLKEKIKIEYKQYTEFKEKTSIELEKERVEYEINKLNSPFASILYTIISMVITSMIAIFLCIITIFNDIEVSFSYKNIAILAFFIVYIFVSYLILKNKNNKLENKLKYYYIANSALIELEKELS